MLLVGKTNSGKTYAAGLLLAASQRLVVIDGKGRMSLEEWRVKRVKSDELEKNLREDSFRLILRPAEDELPDIGTLLLAFTDIQIYIDELFFIFPTNKREPHWSALWSRGRELQIGVWAAVQRPSFIPLLTMTEADHVFTFRLQGRSDRQRIAELVGIEDLPRLKDHSFLYADLNGDTRTIYHDIQLDKSFNVEYTSPLAVTV